MTISENDRSLADKGKHKKLMTEVIDISSDNEAESNLTTSTKKGGSELKHRELPLYISDSEDDAEYTPQSPVKRAGWRTIVSDSESHADTVEEEANDDKESILVLNDPKSARKPIQRSSKPSLSPIKTSFASGIPDSPYGDVLNPRNALMQNNGTMNTPSKSSSSKAKNSAPLVSPQKITTDTPNANRKPRGGKKAQEEAKLQSLMTYAEALFVELNETVFQNGLPTDCNLDWNARLNKTAGRASWSTSSGKSCIQLSPKVLDCEERVRNTLSHEMCHLASWIIDKNVNEAHGNIFKSWAKKVMSKRPEIEITTKHHYEITYKYYWKCSFCDYIYGRHSKSIDPKMQVCGACLNTDAQLVPQFESRPRKTKVESQLASGSPSSSPISIHKQRQHLSMPGSFDSPSPLRNEGTISTDEIETINVSISDKRDKDVNTLIKQLTIIDLTED